ncbi:MAG: pilus assembly PilX N-terminal domain-containing protein [Desulfobulbaceae bacterium]|nr:pilus assembly PilX N-terminal domain-containing protein [Desulfobulbaceae bacterium]
MTSPDKIATKEQGFVLVTALLIMLVLTIIGIAANRNTSTELLIAGNDRTGKESFYQADGGVEIGAETLEQSLACIKGFPVATFPEPFNAAPNDRTGGALLDNFIYISPDSLDFWKNFTPTNKPSDTDRDLAFPWNYQGNDPHTNINIAGDTKMTTGAAIQMLAGYEGKGKGISAGGTYLVYDILSQHLGKNNSEAVVYLLYRHIIGQEGSCYY